MVRLYNDYSFPMNNYIIINHFKLECTLNKGFFTVNDIEYYYQAMETF